MHYSNHLHPAVKLSLRQSDTFYNYHKTMNTVALILGAIAVVEATPVKRTRFNEVTHPTPSGATSKKRATTCHSLFRRIVTLTPPLLCLPATGVDP